MVNKSPALSCPGMLRIAFLFFLTPMLVSGNAQSIKRDFRDHTGEFYFYWGWNWDSFSKSDLHFTGADYDFTLFDVASEDKPKKFTFNDYFNPARASIPQYNVRIGYFLSPHYNVSIAMDHMKYVVINDQTVQISGNIGNTQTEYDGDYDHDPLVISKEFLQFEHTNGLNYFHVEMRRMDDLLNLHPVRIHWSEGLGFGFLRPKTDASLLNFERYDAFHIAGYGLNATGALQVSFFDIFFAQIEGKVGYINMPDIRTTALKSDKASQHFFFTQANVVFGGYFRFGHPSRSSSDLP